MTARRDPAHPRPLRVVSSDDRYPDWEAVYQDNATWVYRMIYASAAEVRTYLRNTARTVLAAHWRQTMGREITEIEADIAAPPHSEEAISAAPERVASVLEALPDNYRRILELRFLQNRSIKESAADMGVSVANAKVLQHRALRLAAQVNEKGTP